MGTSGKKARILLGKDWHSARNGALLSLLEQPAPGSPPAGPKRLGGQGSAANDVANLREIPVSTLKRNGTTATKFDLVTFNLNDRRSFIGGSDARIIMGTDEANLVRLWQE